MAWSPISSLLTEQLVSCVESCRPKGPQLDDPILLQLEEPLLPIVACKMINRTVHTVCCKNLLQVDKRKVREGGEVKAEMANQNLEDWQSHCQNLVPNKQFQTVLTEKVKRD